MITMYVLHTGICRTRNEEDPRLSHVVMTIFYEVITFRKSGGRALIMNKRGARV